MYLNSNIRFLRIQHGYSQEDLSSMLGYKSFTTIQKWESGVSDPPFKTVKKLSEIFNIDIDALNDKDLSSGTQVTGTSKASSGILINVVGKVAAGIPIEAIENIIDTEEISQKMAASGEYFGLRIQGNSMEPRIKDGDVVIVRKQEDAESGDVVIVLVNGDEGTCKRLKKYEDGIMLLSNNPEYEPMIFDKEAVVNKPVRIIGKVVELRAKF